MTYPLDPQREVALWSPTVAAAGVEHGDVRAARCRRRALGGGGATRDATAQPPPHRPTRVRRCPAQMQLGSRARSQRSGSHDAVDDDADRRADDDVGGVVHASVETREAHGGRHPDTYQAAEPRWTAPAGEIGREREVHRRRRAGVATGETRGGSRTVEAWNVGPWASHDGGGRHEHDGLGGDGREGGPQPPSSHRRVPARVHP